MPRIRTIKPEAFDDEDLCALSPLHRWCYAGLWCQADKAGRLEDRPKRLKARVLPFDEVEMDAILTDLARAAFIIRYVVDGKAYIAIKPTSWKKHQYVRNDELESAIPPPELGSLVYASLGPDESLAVSMRRQVQALEHDTATVTEQSLDRALASPGKERKGIGREGKVIAPFETFWLAYPKKKSKSDAEKVWTKLAPSPALLQRILDAIAAQRSSPDWLEQSGRFIPYPATWLNAKRWQDEADVPVILASVPIVDWFAECQALHAGLCNGSFAHRLKLEIDAKKAEAV